MNKILKHPIVSTVVGGLMLTSLLWLFGLIPVPAIWKWLKGAIANLFELLATPIEVQLWILLVIIPILILLKKVIFPKLAASIRQPSPKPPEEDYQSATMEATAEPAPEPIELTEEEIGVLKLLVHKDGAAAEYSNLKHRLNLPRLRAEQIIEALSELGLVKVYENYFHGPQIHLTTKGRDFILGNKYNRT